jgi:hypothetical protein
MTTHRERTDARIEEIKSQCEDGPPIGHPGFRLLARELAAKLDAVEKRINTCSCGKSGTLKIWGGGWLRCTACGNKSRCEDMLSGIRAILEKD